MRRMNRWMLPLLAWAVAVVLGGCIRDNIPDCPPLQVTLTVKDKNYFNIDDAVKLGMMERKADNLPFRDYVGTLYYVVTDGQGTVVAEQKNTAVDNDLQQQTITLPADLPYGDYTVTVTAGDGKTVSHAVALSYRFSQSLPKPGREAEILRTALEQERKNGLQPEGYRYLSEALRRAKLEKESKEFYETLLRRQNAIEPEVLFRHYEATRLEEQLKQEKYENAAKDLRALIGRLTAPAELGAARLALAEVEFYGLGRRKEAEAELAKIDRSALPKARVRPYEVLEMELAAAGQGKAAASALAARIDAPANRYTPRQLLALDGVKLSIRNAIVLKKFADGLRYADELEEKQPAIRLSPDYLQLRGRLEAGLGRPRAAARLLEQALLLEPDDELCAQLSLVLGQFYAGRGESAAAVGSWKQAVAAAPRSHAAATAARLLNEIRNREVER